MTERDAEVNTLVLDLGQALNSWGLRGLIKVDFVTLVAKSLHRRGWRKMKSETPVSPMWIPPQGEARSTRPEIPLIHRS